MKKYVVSSFISLLCVVAIMTVTGYAQVPQKINYQGFLEDSMGIPIDKKLQMTFAIYDAPAGGANLWSEIRDIEVNDGRYSVILGEINPINLTEAKTYYLGLKIDDELVKDEANNEYREELTIALYALFVDGVNMNLDMIALVSSARIR